MVTQCHRCGNLFQTNQTLLYHLTKKKIRCDIYRCCGTIFTNKTRFEIHKTSNGVHSNMCIPTVTVPTVTVPSIIPPL